MPLFNPGVSPPLTLTTGPNSITKGFNITQDGPNSGTTATGEVRYNEIAVSSGAASNATAPSTMLPFADHVVTALKVTQTEETNVAGFQIPILARLNHNVATDIWSLGDPADHIVIAAQGHSTAADTAIGGEGAGFYGISAAVWLESGAVHQHVVGINPEVISEVGASVQNRVGIRLQSASFAGAGVRGADLDAAMSVVSITNSWKDGIHFGEPNGLNGDPPLHTSGSLMKSANTFTITNGLYFPTTTVTGHIFNFGPVVGALPTYSVSGTGHTIASLNNTSESGFQVSQAHSGGVAGFTAQGNGSAFFDCGVRCTARASYGALVANDGYIYGTGSTGLTIMADNATGVIKFATGGNSERGRISSSGVIQGPSGTGGMAIQGTATNDSAATGIVGEYVSGELASGSATSLTNLTAKTVTSISLTAGDWDVTGMVGFVTAATTRVYQIVASISTTNNTLDGATDRQNQTTFDQTGIVPNTSNSRVPIPNARISISSTTTVYLVAFGWFDTSTMTAYGKIWARRVR